MPRKDTAVSPQQIQDIQDQVFDLAETLVPQDFYLLDIAFEQESGAWFLRIYVDALKDEMTLDRCADISHLLEPAIDEKIDLLKDRYYNLEVSSPGLFRQLKSQRELTYYKGQLVNIKTAADKTGRLAMLQGVDSDAQNVLLTEASVSGSDITESTPFSLPLTTKDLVITLSPNFYPQSDNTDVSVSLVPDRE
ncbi:MAG: hypothetical protein KTR14_03730 [Vampirovibrio sp.]|nr:hypothetical protein [Vampirovibrio sp.]